MNVCVLYRIAEINQVSVLLPIANRADPLADTAWMQLSVLVTSREIRKTLFRMLRVALYKEASMLAARGDVAALLGKSTHTERAARDKTCGQGHAPHEQRDGHVTHPPVLSSAHRLFERAVLEMKWRTHGCERRPMGASIWFVYAP